jgi:hypothetical protein
MRSPLAERLNQQRRDHESRRTIAERVALALSLGRRDLERFARAQGLELAEARRELNRRRQLGRRPSAVMQELDR